MKKLFFLCCITFNLHAVAEPVSISFLDLENVNLHHNKTVQIKGFLYKEPHHLILASEPNLKSCCLNQKPQIYVNDLLEVPSLNTALTLQGELLISFHTDESGKMNKRYYLDHSKVIEESNKSNNSIMLTISLSLIMILSLYKIGKQR